MAETLNSGSLTFTTGLLTGPVSVLTTEASRFRCSVVKVYVSTDDTEGSYSYVGYLSAENPAGLIASGGEYYVRVDLQVCSDAEVYVDFISS